MENPFILMGWYFILLIIGLIVIWLATAEPEPDLDGEAEEIQPLQLEHKE